MDRRKADTSGIGEKVAVRMDACRYLGWDGTYGESSGTMDGKIKGLLERLDVATDGYWVAHPFFGFTYNWQVLVVVSGFPLAHVNEFNLN